MIEPTALHPPHSVFNLHKGEAVDRGEERRNTTATVWTSSDTAAFSFHFCGKCEKVKSSIRYNQLDTRCSGAARIHVFMQFAEDYSLTYGKIFIGPSGEM